MGKLVKSGNVYLNYDSTNVIRVKIIHKNNTLSIIMLNLNVNTWWKNK